MSDGNGRHPAGHRERQRTGQGAAGSGLCRLAPGQLEDEIQSNGWLNCPADPELVFDAAIDRKYNRALDRLGVDPIRLVNDAGHA
ncbi:MAG: hypothetical protein A49_25680 [Methyloceanibacter sp.]|nr:MAG: hypothetical protein A49_25680 [Methyloceanibacter sp.]